MVAPEGSAPGPRAVERPIPEPSALVIEIAGRIDRADIPLLCERVRVALEGSSADLLVCDVGSLAEPDCVAVDALARLRLTARRLGRGVELRGISPELQALLCFVGIGDVLAGGATSGVEARRQPE